MPKPLELDASLQDLVRALLRCEEEEELFPDFGGVGVGVEEDAEPIERRQHRLCFELLERIKALPAQERNEEEATDEGFLRRRNPQRRSSDRMEIDEDDDDDDDFLDVEELASPNNIRSILGPAAGTSSAVSRLVAVLVDGMNRRVDPRELLPLTYDENANEQALLGTAITLTHHSLSCAELYARLLAVPGALGAGIVDMGTLQGVSAVVERWSAECRGSEGHAEPRPTDAAAGAGRGANRASTRRSQPTKRRKKPAPRAAEYVSSSDDDGDDDNSDGSEVEAREVDGQDAATAAKLTASELLLRGLDVAAAVSRLPTAAHDFFSWSEEAREVALSATLTALAMSSSLRQAKKLSPATLASIVQVVEQSSAALGECVPMAASETLDSETLTKRVHATRTILKGLNSLLLFQREVPVGQKGKQAAAEAAAGVLEKLIAGVTADMENNPHSWPKDPLEAAAADASAAASPLTEFASPGADGTAATGAHTPKTANKTPHHRTPFSKARRRSNGGGMTITPLRLKSASKTPGTAGLFSPALQGKLCAAKPRPVLGEVLALLQRLMLDPALEAAAATRHHVVDTVNRCIPRLPQHERALYVACLGSLLQSKWWYCRQVSCEVASRVLREAWFWRGTDAAGLPARLDTGTVPSSARSASSANMGSGFQVAESIFKGLVGRLDDKDRNLRISCANGLTTLFQTIRSEECSAHVRDCLVQLTSKRSAALCRMLRECCLEEDKALAKKAFIGALVELLVTSQTTSEMESALTFDDIDIFSRFCQDVSLETRRAASEALSTLLEATIGGEGKHKNEVLMALEMAWSESVLPLRSESDSRLASKMQALFDRILFDPIVGGDVGSARTQSAWRIVGDASVQSGGVESLSALLRRKLSESRGECLRPLVTTLANIACSTLLDTPNEPDLTPVVRARRDGAWCLLKAVLAATSSVSDLIRILKKNNRGLGLFVDCWKIMIAAVASQAADDDGDGLVRSLGYCLEVMAALSSKFDVDLAIEAAASIERSLGGFTVPKPTIGIAVTAFVTLTAAICNSKDGKGVVHRQCGRKIRLLLDVCENEIASSVQGSLEGVSESRLVRALFTVGELCLVGFSEDEDATTRSDAKESSIASDILLGMHERPSPRLVQLVQTLLSPTVLTTDSQAVPNPSVIRSLAFLTLGKLCLRDESLTIQSVNLFARELHEGGNGSPEVQANALVVLGDLSVRYANHVDRFLPVMATCLQAGVSEDMAVLDPVNRDGYEVVRVQAIHLLSNLIMQDYIKWRGLLFHRFLVATADDVDQVAFVAKRTLSGPLLNKKPQLFVQNFVESIFVLNRCTTHPIYKAASMSGDGGSGISVDFEGIHLDGTLGNYRRFLIYKMMLNKMSDEQKVEVTARLAKEVLGNALESGNDIYRLCHFANPDGLNLESHPTYARAFHVLRDALVILRSKLARVARRRAQEPPGVVGGGENAASRSDRVASLKGELLSKVNRTQLVDIIVPILVRLKAALQKNRSPLLQDLMGYLLAVFESYPNECRDILGNEPQVLAEIEYDAKAARRSRQALRESNSFTR